MVQAFLSLISNFAAGCGNSNFFGFPTWHKYLEKDPTYCSPMLGSIDDIWKIGLAIIELLLRLAVLVAIVYVLMGGVKYITARGNADKLEVAKTSVIDALAGLVIAIAASAVVAFIGSRFTQS